MADLQREYRLDLSSGVVKKRKSTPQGGLIADANLTRTGIFPYRTPDGGTRRELRSPDEVFHPDSLASYPQAPVTVDHPGKVGPDNWKTHAVGHLGGKDSLRRNGDHLAGEIHIQHGDAMRRAENDELREVSCGYHCDLDPTPGTYQGQPYDAVQRNIRINHVAIGPPGWGRMGPETRMHLDSGAAVSGEPSPVERIFSPVPDELAQRADAASAEAAELGSPAAHEAAASAHRAAAAAHLVTDAGAMAAAHLYRATEHLHRATLAVRADDEGWDESKHPRAPDGKFGEGGGSPGGGHAAQSPASSAARAPAEHGRVETKRTWTDKLPPGIKDDETWKTHYDKHPDEGGKPSAERVEQVHKPIIEEALNVKPAEPGEQKLAIMTMGAPASGKSSALKGTDTSKFVKVDPDAIKEKLPEYQAAIADHDATYKGAALMAHEESSAVAKQIMKEAIARGNHIIVDGTGANADSFIKKMKALQDAGYKVHVAMPHLEENEGISRMMARAAVTGRMVPEKFARDAYKTIPKNFERIARQADSFRMVDNSGKAPRPVWDGEKGKADKVHDEAFVSAFKANHHDSKDEMDDELVEDARTTMQATPENIHASHEAERGLAKRYESSEDRYGRGEHGKSGDREQHRAALGKLDMRKSAQGLTTKALERSHVAEKGHEHWAQPNPMRGGNSPLAHTEAAAAHWEAATAHEKAGQHAQANAHEAKAKEHYETASKLQGHGSVSLGAAEKSGLQAMKSSDIANSFKNLESAHEHGRAAEAHNAAAAAHEQAAGLHAKAVGGSAGTHEVLAREHRMKAEEHEKSSKGGAAASEAAGAASFAAKEKTVLAAGMRAEDEHGNIVGEPSAEKRAGEAHLRAAEAHNVAKHENSANQAKAQNHEGREAEHKAAAAEHASAAGSEWDESKHPRDENGKFDAADPQLLSAAARVASNHAATARIPIPHATNPGAQTNGGASGAGTGYGYSHPHEMAAHAAHTKAADGHKIASDMAAKKGNAILAARHTHEAAAHMRAANDHAKNAAAAATSGVVGDGSYVTSMTPDEQKAALEKAQADAQKAQEDLAKARSDSAMAKTEAEKAAAQARADKAEVATLKAEKAVLEQQLARQTTDGKTAERKLAEDKALMARTEELIELRADARMVFASAEDPSGSQWKADGKTADAIRREILLHLDPTFKADSFDGFGPEVAATSIARIFDLTIGRERTAAKARADALDVTRSPRLTGDGDDGEGDDEDEEAPNAEEARKAMMKKKRDGWKAKKGDKKVA